MSCFCGWGVDGGCEGGAGGFQGVEEMVVESAVYAEGKDLIAEFTGESC